MTESCFWEAVLGVGFFILFYFGVSIHKAQLPFCVYRSVGSGQTYLNKCVLNVCRQDVMIRQVGHYYKMVEWFGLEVTLKNNPVRPYCYGGIYEKAQLEKDNCRTNGQVSLRGDALHLSVFNRHLGMPSITRFNISSVLKWSSSWNGRSLKVPSN